MKQCRAEKLAASRHLHSGLCRRMCRDAPVAGGRGKERVKTSGRTRVCRGLPNTLPSCWQRTEPFCCHRNLTAGLFCPQSRKQRSQDASRTLGVAAGCAVALLVAVVCLSSGEGTDGHRTATRKPSPRPNSSPLSNLYVQLFACPGRPQLLLVLDPQGHASGPRETPERIAMSIVTRTHTHTHTHTCIIRHAQTHALFTRKTSNGRGHDPPCSLGW
jgi:hypothetical protein